MIVCPRCHLEIPIAATGCDCHPTPTRDTPPDAAPHPTRSNDNG